MLSRTVLLVAAVSLLVLAPRPPDAEAGGGCHRPAMPEATTAITTDIDLAGCAFIPTVAVVEPGATVSFRNTSSLPHTVTGAGASMLGTDLWSSEERTWTAPDEPGVHPFACLVHPGMVGAVVVSADGQAARLDAAVSAAAPGDGDTAVPSVPVVLVVLMVGVALLAGAAVRGQRTR